MSSVWGDDKLIGKAEGLRFFWENFCGFAGKWSIWVALKSQITKTQRKDHPCAPRYWHRRFPLMQRMGLEGRNLPGIVHSHLQGSCCGADETGWVFLSAAHWVTPSFVTLSGISQFLQNDGWCHCSFGAFAGSFDLWTLPFLGKDLVSHLSMCLVLKDVLNSCP